MAKLATRCQWLSMAMSASSWFCIGYSMPALPSNCIGKLAKNNDIVKDLTQFEPETDPMPADGKVGIGNRMPLVVDCNVSIESFQHRNCLPSVTEYPRLTYSLPFKNSLWCQEKAIFHSQFVIVLKILMGLAYYMKHQRKYYLLRWFLSQFHLV